MSKITKWKLEKTKVKVVFRLQFHATHIPQNGWDKLFISFIPADSGKITAKTTKANVRNGTCKWADPIYETTRLLQDLKSKQYDDKFYKLVVAMGSSRSSILGEATINLADYADALKPSAVALPLHGTNSGSILHVTVQLLTSKTGFREFEQQRELREKGFQTGLDLNRHDGSGSGKVLSSEEISHEQVDKVNARLLLGTESKASHSLREVTVNEESADSATGFDVSSNTSESIYAEKHDASSIHDADSLKSTASGDLHALSHSLSPQTEKGDPSDHRVLAHGSNDSVHGWTSDYSVDNDLTIAYEENSRLKASLEMAESSVFELKLEVNSLQSHADEIGVETQRLAKELGAEIASSEELAKEIAMLKSECLKFKDDLETLRSLKLNPQISRSETVYQKQDHLFHDMQLTWLKGLSILEDRVRGLQHRAYLGLHDVDPKVLCSELEVLLNILHNFKTETGLTISPVNVVPLKRTDVNEIRAIDLQKSDQFVPGTGLDLDLYQPESMLHYLNIPGLVSQEPDSVASLDAVNAKIFELLRELDEAKVEKESLVRKMDQMECYYEALVRELEENQKQMLGELHNIRNEHTACLYTITSQEAEMESMRREMNQQIQQFSVERHELDTLNKELEVRATTSEASLRRARLNYSIAVDQLQKDLALLSSQVVSLFETNDNLIKQVFSETSQPCLLDPEESGLKNYTGMKKPLSGGDVLLGDLKKSFSAQEQLYEKVEQELCEMHLVNLQLDVFSKALHETLLEASTGIKFMKEKIDELAQKLEISTESNYFLTVKLQTAMDEVRALNDYKASCIAKFSDLIVQDQRRETELDSLMRENSLLNQKIKESEAMVTKYKQYESRLEICSSEKAELMLLLEQETLENGKLQNEMSSLKKQLKTLKDEIYEFSSSEERLLKTINTVRDKLGSILLSYDNQFGGLSLSENHFCQDLGSKDPNVVISHLEEIQQNACRKIVQIMEEKKGLVNEREIAEISLNNARSEILFMKQKFKDEIQDMVAKLDVSNLLVDRLQLELESVANKLHISSEVEETYAEQSKELLADLALLEVELQKLTSNNGDLTRDMLGLDTLAEELGRSQSSINGLKQENQDVMMLLKQKNEEYSELASEYDKLKENLRCLNEELEVERGSKQKLEHAIDELTRENQDVMMLLKQKNEEYSELASQLDSLKENLRCMHKELEVDRGSKQKLECAINDLTQENQDVMTSLKQKIEEYSEFASRLDNLKEKLRCLDEELEVERGSKQILERTVNDLTAQLSEKHDKLLHFDGQEAELLRLRQLVSDLELEKSRVCRLLVQREECLEKLRQDSGFLAELESQLTEMHGYLIAEDVNLTCVRTQYEALYEEFVQHLQSSDAHIMELKERHIDTEATLNCCIVSEARHIEESRNLGTVIESLRYELETCSAQNRILTDSNNVLTVELEKCKNLLETMEVGSSREQKQHAMEVEQLKQMLMDAEREISNLMFSKEELEIAMIVLEAKLDEQHDCVILLEEYRDELKNVKTQCCELTQKLSEQILKTEEFKNLTIHLKELKDKADAESLQSREKREPEGPPVAMQESLRIAFIKEQYETRLQELKQQLSVSRKHGEEMLWKLQDAIDENENRKKSEASHIKRNEELSLKILEMEAELQLVNSDKREKVKAYDRLKAELECALLSLECCKEEKDKLEAALQDCDEEKSRIAAELASIKEQLENTFSLRNIQKEENARLESHKVEHGSGELIIEKEYREDSIDGASSLVRITKDVHENGSTGGIEDVSSVSSGVDEQSTMHMNVQPIEDILETKGSLHFSSKQLAVYPDHFRAESLKSSMEHLCEELERMKNENSPLQPDNHFDPDFQGLQKELMQLGKVNEDLGSIFPWFTEFGASGSALERVLALEMELAESLQAKKKSSLHFQSSFLKQHSDEEAVLKSFRDINELIKDMLEVKGRYASVQSELKEMHDRYSQLSLQFAEVEGERQKLMMTLKNIRATKKLTNLNRFVDHHSHPS